jgi:hypothetical protein
MPADDARRRPQRLENGLERARKQRRVGGRPRKDEDYKLMGELQKLRQDGLSIRKIAGTLSISPHNGDEVD